MGRLGVRRSGHHRRARRLRILGPQAHALAGRNRQRIARAEGVRRRTLDCSPWSSLSFCHCIWSGYGLFVASRAIPFLIQNAVVSGALYGVVVYFFMNRIVLPLSAAAKRPFSLKLMIIGVIIHIFCVGLPISLSVRRFSR